MKNNSKNSFDKISLNGERYMLIGGAGFIGHHLALNLKKYGAEVLIVDDMQVNNIIKILTSNDFDVFKRKLYLKFIFERIELLRENHIDIKNIDARNLINMQQVFSDFQPTKAIHLAAVSSAIDANKAPNQAYDIQINSLRNLLSLCTMKNSTCNYVTFMSSSTVYGDFDKEIVDERVRPKPRGVYANGKYIGERMVREAKSLYGLNYTIIRPSALYGIRCVSGRVSQKFIENALDGKTLRLEGGGDGMLDFTHIDDLVEGITRATSFKNGIDRTFNITFGNARKIIDIANIIKDVIPNVKFEITPAQPEKPKRGTLSVQKSKDLLGFYPKKHIDDAYKDYCIWYIKQWEELKKNFK